ncbi:LegC family aminotransferase [Prolixibacter denitrificans]|uniref:GDP-perosamine synthase n=1 Tax=Prolixibacter denitrificans TaxID=1541063 RepID=A0A2P8C8P2_9BACT|nr:LegC family aminotransferase [Prolixibacter denitrificans]PSK81332.1 aminotransferase in exopolysaccharide biosynthesis [Prolixibacter denitrificans]GET21583.1 aminotransferase DegT [Prolixibacter denitrificans]
MNHFSEIVQFIRNTFNQPEGFIPLHAPVFSGNEKKYMEECIDSTFVSSVGKFVDQFEEKMADFTGAAKAVVCVNGTNALHMALMLVGVERGDEVITQSLTFIATANAISYCGANPVLLDVDKDTMGLSPKALEHFLEQETVIKSDGCYNKKTNKKISACVPMHTFGHPCRIDEIVAICQKYHIEVVEDAAESVGSYYKNQHTGTFGKIGVLSFNGNKIMTTGGGGMLLFNDIDLANRAKHLTTQAKVAHPWEFRHDDIGYNYRMPNINAALGLAQLEQINKFLKVKRKLAERYADFFKEEEIDFVDEPQMAKSNYWLNAIIFQNLEERNSFLEFTNNNGVMTRPAWELMNRLPMFRNAQCQNLTNSEWLSERLVNIPSSVI